MHYAFLSRGIISLTGEDTLSFLQGLVSNDVMPLQEGRMVYTALLSPQGKFLFDFFLVPQEGGVWLDCYRERLPELLARLNMYKLRSKVTLKEVADGRVAAWWDGAQPPAHPGVLLHRDSRLAALGWRLTGSASAVESYVQQLGARRVSEEAYERLRLECGVPDGAHDMIPDKSLLMEFGFEDLRGVDFKKGCYVGQEVTARSKHRAALRKFIYQVSAEKELPPAGSPVFFQGAPAGEMRSSEGNIGLALLRIAEAEKSQSVGIALECAGVGLKAVLPQWVTQAPKALAVEE